LLIDWSDWKAERNLFVQSQLSKTLKARRRNRWLVMAATAVPPLIGAGTVKAQPFFMGSDISLLTFMQQQHVNFNDNGVSEPGDQILYNHGDNMFRLRLFVNPDTNYVDSNGAIQTTAYDIALAQQIKQNDPSARFELDLHYSDTWADPGKQVTPAAWSTLSLTGLQTQIQSYTFSTLSAFKAAGVMPDMVQIGNETDNGMLWPAGQINYANNTTEMSTFANYGSLVNHAIAGVRAAQAAGPKIQISLVCANGNQNGHAKFFYDSLTNPTWGNVPASSFDVMGVDYYPTSNDMMTTMGLKGNLTALANEYNKKIMVMETDQPWESNGTPGDTAYAFTQAGQAQYLTDLANVIKGLPNNDGMGLLYWYPESVQVPGFNIYHGGAVALFDSTGKAVQAVSSFSITQHQWNTNASGSWNTAGNWTNSTPNGSDIEADFLSAIMSNQTVSTASSVTLGVIRFQNTNSYSIAGTGSLTLQASVGWAYGVVQQGAQAIDVPVTIGSSAIFAVSSGASLTIGSPLTVNPGQILTLSGSGTINYLSSVTVSNTASMMFGNSTHVTSLSVGTGANVAVTGTQDLLETDSLTNSGTIDVQTNGVLINYGSGPDPVSSIRAMLVSGYNGGAWNGTGIMSSSAAGASASYGVGYVDSADGVATPLASSGQIIVEYALLGDADLNGTVNGIDFGILAANFNQSVSRWDQGDFNYDNIVNGLDFTELAANFNKATNGGAAVSAGDVAALEAFAAANGLLADLPEPGALAAGLVITGALLGRRKR
jgi:arabinogalactan endo-1,4-beta-galactosidase